MNKCRNPQHPHCTQWVMDGAPACEAGHAQPGSAIGGSSFALLAERRAAHPAQALPAGERRAQLIAAALPVGAGSRPVATERRAPVAAGPRPTLHVSGFDPRAAGGRQALRLELRAMPQDVAPQLAMQLRSVLLPGGGTEHLFNRTRHGEWPSTVIEFSSRGREHGQYRIEVELLARRDCAPPRRWTCTLVVLVPRPDATLTEIHQTFLATHKNVRMLADDGSIARLGAMTGGGRVDIDVTARNASIAQINLDATHKADLALPTIAWDEELVETGSGAAHHPQPAQAACLVNAAPDMGELRHIRLFALDECVLGRLDPTGPIADILLAHHGEHGQDAQGLTRRLSAQHAVIRHGRHGFEIEDISRYGVLLDGVWPGKFVPVPLRPGMRIELTASVRNVVLLEVAALLAHAVVLRRIDAGAQAECFCIMAPDRHPDAAVRATSPLLQALTGIHHVNGGFWYHDRSTGHVTALHAGTRCGMLAGIPAHTRFAPAPYPELDLQRPPAEGANMRALRASGLLTSA